MRFWRVLAWLSAAALDLSGGAAQAAEPGALLCVGQARTEAAVEGEVRAAQARTQRWRLRVAADGRVTGPGLAGALRGDRATGRIDGRWAAPTEPVAIDLEVLENRFAVDLSTLRMEGRLVYRFARAPYDHATVRHRRAREVRAACAWAP